MEESLDVVKLTKLFSYGYDSKIDVEFTDDDVNDFNTYIKNNDISSIAHFFEVKSSMCYEVFKDVVHSKVGSFWQYMVDCVCDKFDYNNTNREDFLKQLTDYEKYAVIFGTFSSQVENGGLSQWYLNNYSDDFDSLIEFLKNSDFEKRDEFLSILDNFLNIKNAIEKLDRFNDWYQDDYKTRIRALCDYDLIYEHIEKEWKEYFENYLIRNMPDDYKQAIIDYGKDIKI